MIGARDRETVLDPSEDTASPAPGRSEPHHLRAVNSRPFWDMVRHTAMGRYHYEHEYGFIRRHMERARPPRRILDIACGSGWMSEPLYRSGLKVVGLDLNRLALAHYRQRVGNIPLVAADALQLPFSDNSFDCVIAIECFEYFPEYHRFLQVVNRVLTKGGLLIFDTLNRRSYKWRLKGLVGRPLTYPSPRVSCDDVLRATVDHGFDVQEVSGYNWVPFTKESDSRLLPIAALIEKTLRLDRCYKLSPRILLGATKTRSCEPQQI